jgi:hypothetical protein
VTVVVGGVERRERGVVMLVTNTHHTTALLVRKDLAVQK